MGMTITREERAWVTQMQAPQGARQQKVRSARTQDSRPDSFTKATILCRSTRPNVNVPAGTLVRISEDKNLYDRCVVCVLRVVKHTKGYCRPAAKREEQYSHRNG
jgi:hypothetical protein